MQIHGLNKTTLLDYPEHVAATIFCGSCNFRCPFCHNSELVLNPTFQPEMEEKEVLDYLKKRKGILTGVCITGGEPTLQKDLAEFIYKIKELGYLVKLDTNGYRPKEIERLFEGNLIDFVAMDIKSGVSGYAKAAGLATIEIETIKESIASIMNSRVDYEFRTTVVKGIHTNKDFEEIGRLIEGSERYYLQNFKDSENVMVPGFKSFAKEELEGFVRIVSPYVKKVTLRGVDS